MKSGRRVRSPFELSLVQPALARCQVLCGLRCGPSAEPEDVHKTQGCGMEWDQIQRANTRLVTRCLTEFLGEIQGPSRASRCGSCIWVILGEVVWYLAFSFLVLVVCGPNVTICPLAILRCIQF